MPVECDLSVGNGVYFQKFTDISASTQVNPPSPVLEYPEQFPGSGNQIVGGLCEGKAGKEGTAVRVEPHRGLH